jgi:hypothetical protein
MTKLENTRLVQCFLFVIILTVIAQLFSLAFGRIDPSESFADVVLPSTIVLLAITIPTAGLGLLIWKNIGFGGSPTLYAILSRREVLWAELANNLVATAIAGLVIGLALVGLRIALVDQLPVNLPAFGFRGVLGSLAVSIGAAVGEEVWFRLGLLSTLVWIVSKLTGQGRPNDRTVWSCLLFVAVIFAAAHIPQLASFGAASSIGVAGTIFGNTIVGTLYGWFYWRRGLLAAISVHFWVDVAIHVLPASVA